MRRSIAAWLILLAVVSWAGGAMAADGGLAVHPVAGLYGPERSGCARAGAAATVRIAPELCSQFSPAQRAAWGRRFVELVGGRFGNVRSDLSAPLPAGLTREAMLFQTVVATLHVSRADLWRVEKVSTVDVYMPITLTLMLTNAQTGEVVFSETLSTIVEGPMPRGAYREQAAREFPGHFDKALDKLVASAAARFKPYPISATVRGRADTYFVVDAGRRRGLNEGDYLGVDARVRFADANYALVEPLLGDVAQGQVLRRQVAQPVESLSRPSVLVFSATSGPDGDYFTSLMEEALGSTGLAATPVNPDFIRIRDSAVGDAGLAPRPRALPDYFLRLSIVVLDPYETDTNVRGVRLRVQEAWALVEVLNRDGRVVFATRGSDRKQDEVIPGMTFPPEQRRDTLIRNAITVAADNLGKGFRPQRLRLAAGPGGDGVSIDDPGQTLRPGARGLLVRQAGRVSGVEGTVWRPVGQVLVTAVEGPRGAGRLTGLEAVTARGGDQMAYEATGPGSRERLAVVPCLDQAGQPRTDFRGSVRQPAFTALAVNSLAGHFIGAVYLPDAAGALRPRMAGQFEGLDQLGILSRPAAGACFQPVHQVTAGPERRKGDAVVSSFDVTVGFILWDGDRRLGAAALQSSLTATGLPSGTDAAAKAAALQIDLAGETASLALQSSRQLRPGD